MAEEYPVTVDEFARHRSEKTNLSLYLPREDRPARTSLTAVDISEIVPQPTDDVMNAAHALPH